MTMMVAIDQSGSRLGIVGGVILICVTLSLSRRAIGDAGLREGAGGEDFTDRGNT